MVSEEEPVADGLDHALDPRVIPLQRIAGGLLTAVALLVALVAMVIALVVGDDIARWQRLLLPVAWVVVAALGAWFAYRWPAIRYRHTRYRVDGQGIEIRRGAFWRVVINVPKSRVQHIDVSQGPIERRYGLGQLVIYTAGTDYARVELAGLEHGRALRIRDHLLPSGTGDAV